MRNEGVQRVDIGNPTTQDDYVGVDDVDDHRQRLREVARIAVGTDAPEWSDLERALLRAVDELLDDALIADETWATLAAAFDERQLMDVVFTVGAYDVLAMALRTFAVPLDDDLLGP